MCDTGIGKLPRFWWFKTNIGWEGVMFFSFVGLAVVFAGFLIYLLFVATYRYDHPKTYKDTIEYIMRPIQIAKNEALRTKDTEKFDYWWNLEKTLTEKSLEEASK